jgi:hypothetical protein
MNFNNPRNAIQGANLKRMRMRAGGSDLWSLTPASHYCALELKVSGIESTHMSAINVVRQRDRVVLVTDGAVWDVNAGIVVGFPTKAAAILTEIALPATRARRESVVIAFLLVDGCTEPGGRPRVF